MSLRRNFEIDDDMTQPIKDYKKFTEGLEQVKYAGRLATLCRTYYRRAKLTYALLAPLFPGDSTAKLFFPSLPFPLQH
jgi:hypothetical protein